jgi:hypothetical protein
MLTSRSVAVFKSSVDMFLIGLFRSELDTRHEKALFHAALQTLGLLVTRC